jgi:hypothetical protein
VKFISFDTLKWYVNKYISKLTYYQLIIYAVLLWTVGCWFWIIPTYSHKIKYLKQENYQIAQLIAPENLAKKLPIKLKNIEKINYSGVLAVTQQHSLKLNEFLLLNEKNSGKNQYQFSVKGSWLHVREFISTLTEKYRDNLIINSLDLQRDETTNEATLTIVIADGDI